MILFRSIRAMRWLFLAVVLTRPGDAANADDWMFRRSYYSHHLPEEHLQRYPLPRRRTAYRPAYVGTTPGFAIRGAYRYNRVQLGNGRNADVTIYRQNWFEEEP